jgi:hypothetical protein
MRARRRIVLLAIGMLVVACQKSSEQEAAEAAKATAIASAKAEQAKRELETGDTLLASRTLVESQEAAVQAAREAAQAARALAREHERYHVLLAKEIAWVDRRLAELEASSRSTSETLRAEKELEIAAHREWRARLVEDLALVDRAPGGTEWSALKKKVDQDLDLNRPASIPRSYEKSYGI